MLALLDQASSWPLIAPLGIAGMLVEISLYLGSDTYEGETLLYLCVVYV